MNATQHGRAWPWVSLLVAAAVEMLHAVLVVAAIKRGGDLDPEVRSSLETLHVVAACAATTGVTCLLPAAWAAVKTYRVLQVVTAAAVLAAVAGICIEIHVQNERAALRERTALRAAAKFDPSRAVLDE